MKIYIINFLLILSTFSNNYSQNFWEKTSAPDDVPTYSLAINSSGYIFAGAYTSGATVGSSDGLYRSTDNGDNWLKLGLSSSYEVHSVFTSSNGDILVGTWQYGGTAELFRSTDNGDSWNTLGINRLFTSIAVNSNGHIFVGAQSGGGILRSTDDGVNWVPKNEGLSSTDVKSLIIKTNGDIFAGTFFGGVNRSTDNGNTWVPINNGLTTSLILSLAINSGGDIFAGTSGGGVFLSTNNGDDWVEINQGLAGEALYVRSLLIHLNGVILAGTAVGIFRSDDNGANWVQINLGLTNNDVQSLAINSKGGLFAGTGGGIFRSVITANLKVFLQGPNTGGGAMTTTLNTNTLIPLNSNTAYPTLTYGYTASTVTSIPNSNIVDWVLVELRTGTASGTKVATRAGFLKSDGTIVDTNGVSPLQFAGLGDGNYYAVVRHRNHLAILSANAIPLSNNSVLYDFTTLLTPPNPKAYGTNPMLDVGGGVWAMIAGDANEDGNITTIDYNLWLPDNNSAASGYLATDMNLDGNVTTADYNLWLPSNNAARSSQVP